MVRIGELRHYVEVRTSTETRDQYGEALKTWSVLTTAYAKREDVESPETVADMQTIAKPRARFTMRFLSSVTNTVRLTTELHDWNILSVTADNRRAWMTILAERED